MKKLALFAFAATMMMSVSCFAQESIYDFTVKDINSKEVSLADYKGKVLLIVNVGYRCHQDN